MRRNVVRWQRVPGFPLFHTHPWLPPGPRWCRAGLGTHCRPVTGVSASVAGTSLQHEQASLPYNVLPACSAWKVDSSKEGVAGEMRYWREAFDAVDTDADGYQHTHAHGMPGPFEYLPQGRISLDMHLRMGGPCPRLGAIPGHW